jgi:hypothetical protein
MLLAQFDEIVSYRCNEIKRILCKKSKEYATETDRLHNFKRASRMLNCTPEKALMGMAAKHFVSVLDIVDSVDIIHLPSIAMIEEKIGDSINYLVLLEAVLKETINGISIP